MYSFITIPFKHNKIIFNVLVYFVFSLVPKVTAPTAILLTIMSFRKTLELRMCSSMDNGVSFQLSPVVFSDVWCLLVDCVHSPCDFTVDIIETVKNGDQMLQLRQNCNFVNISISFHHNVIQCRRRFSKQIIILCIIRPVVNRRI